MEAYLVLVESQAFAADSTGKLSAATLAFPKKVRFVALKETQEHALNTAMEHNAAKGLIANSDTEWFVLKVTFSADEVVALFQAGTLIRDIPRGGWRHYGELDLKSFQHEWAQVKIGPIGMQAWADMILSKRYQVKICGECSGCKTAGVTWVGGKAWNTEEYCVNCWHSYFASKYAEPEEEEAMDESAAKEA
eukprot:gb/GFBE01038004.1/.p1 GENE.gb/GFBE01038004.1/~~gb/GFBE01038004.1/.p1  ORF type:complete len:192 (+),score=61.88 gb/GFBE01038004.1/:1-576(+)